MASSQRPRLSLPPELGAIDEGWGSDEQPTVARPSCIPTSPARAGVPDELPGAPDLPIELAELEDDARVTSIPEVPSEDFARRIMLEVEQAVTEAPPPPRISSRTDSGEFLFNSTPQVDPEGPFDEAMSFDPAESASPFDPDPAAQPTSEERASAFPTGPPPLEFDVERARTLPRHESVTEEPFGEAPIPQLGGPFRGSESATQPQPFISDRREPIISERTEPLEFSGRFSSAPPETASNHQTMKDRFAMGDFSGALGLAEAILRLRPDDGEAHSLAVKCREVLQDMYSSRISDMSSVPLVAMGPDQIRWLSLDHRAGFMLSMIDGISSVDDLLDVSGMQRLDALRILCSLLDQKVIKLT